MTIKLDHAELKAHAGKIATAGDEVGTAAAAADTVVMNGDTFGQMCAWVPPVFQKMMPSQAGAIHSAATALDTAQQALMWAANDIVDSDASIASRLNGIDVP